MTDQKTCPFKPGRCETSTTMSTYVVDAPCTPDCALWVRLHDIDSGACAIGLLGLDAATKHKFTRVEEPTE